MPGRSAFLAGIGVLLVITSAPTPAQERAVETESLLGGPLARPELPIDFVALQRELLADAEGVLDERPDDADALIWVGRRTAYLGRYRDAIEIYTAGIDRHPEDARMFRHRGHRLLSVRRLDEAARDLERAAELIAGHPDEIEPDGLPNERGIPTSTLQSNIWYHLGLAYYLQGDFERALDAYLECLEVSANPDMLSATSHWLYMTLRRLGHDDKAAEVLRPFAEPMEIIENRDYHRLLLMYRGENDLAAEMASSSERTGVRYPTLMYGVGNWHFYNGRSDEAAALWREIVDSEASWAAFGYIAAEAELSRLGR